MIVPQMRLMNCKTGFRNQEAGVRANLPLEIENQHKDELALIRR